MKEVIILKLCEYFTKKEKLLWGISAAVIVFSFFAFNRNGDLLTLAASLIGVTSLIFAAKANPIGQVLMIAFSLLYGVISYSSAYYGEMITYLGMTMPMSVIALVSWIRHPFGDNRAEVKVNRISKREVAFMFALTAVITFAFYFILAALSTAQLPLSTVSVATSFAAVYLTFRRDPRYALAYAANDIVLIVLWILQTALNLAYLSVVICFCAFFANDIYGYSNWKHLERRQKKQSA